MNEESTCIYNLLLKFDIQYSCIIIHVYFFVLDL